MSTKKSCKFPDFDRRTANLQHANKILQSFTIFAITLSVPLKVEMSISKLRAVFVTIEFIVLKNLFFLKALKKCLIFLKMRLSFLEQSITINFLCGSFLQRLHWWLSLSYHISCQNISKNFNYIVKNSWNNNQRFNIRSVVCSQTFIYHFFYVYRNDTN